jgi:hypothetical protein
MRRWTKNWMLRSHAPGRRGRARRLARRGEPGIRKSRFLEESATTAWPRVHWLGPDGGVGLEVPGGACFPGPGELADIPAWNGRSWARLPVRPAALGTGPQPSTAHCGRPILRAGRPTVRRPRDALGTARPDSASAGPSPVDPGQNTTIPQRRPVAVQSSGTSGAARCAQAAGRAVADMVSEILGAVPDEGWTSRWSGQGIPCCHRAARRAAGRGQIARTPGSARLASGSCHGCWPSSVLGCGARPLGTAGAHGGAVLGRSFSLDDVALLLRGTPAPAPWG